MKHENKIKEILKEIELLDIDLDNIKIDLSQLENRKNSIMGVYIVLAITYLSFKDASFKTTILIIFVLFVAYYIYEWFRNEIIVCKANKLFKRKKELIIEKHKLQSKK